ncbi:MAG TPA: endonuclease Q family protein [Syntrophomonadaceae bacterium]|nr:endonuclease Q family protein [Syntrophomonadaceae bacterium]HQE23980.1 endonuclease Q family protein [Syntrophomonadaceae bacterium]
MRSVYADLHVHIGRASGRPVKITASRSLTLANLLNETVLRKGLNIVGIVDAGTAPVLAELEKMVDQGQLEIHQRGGFMTAQGVMLLAGCEVETREGVHIIIYLPDLDSLHKYQKFMRSRVKNMELSTQRCKADIRELLNLSHVLGGVFCPAHAFTPHKGFYGMLASSFQSYLGRDASQIHVLELGLSADTDMADTINETRHFTFLSNSDAHSAGNVGREYNLLRLAELNFEEFRLAVYGHEGRRVLANYGMDPLMGKYHRSYCPQCDQIMQGEPPVVECPICGNDKLVMGVYDRIVQIQDHREPYHPVGRPPYRYRVPLTSMPGVGPTTYQKLIQYLGNEIEVMERASFDDIARVAGNNVAALVMQMRAGRIPITPGGGGVYGKIQVHNCNQ